MLKVPKCPVKSNPELHVSQKPVTLGLTIVSGLSFSLGSGYCFCRLAECMVKRTLHDLSAPLKLSQSARGRFVTLIDVGMYLITCNA